MADRLCETFVPSMALGQLYDECRTCGQHKADHVPTLTRPEADARLTDQALHDAFAAAMNAGFEGMRDELMRVLFPKDPTHA